jgi:hypothetical protein
MPDGLILGRPRVCVSGPRQIIRVIRCRILKLVGFEVLEQETSYSLARNDGAGFEQERPIDTNDRPRERFANRNVVGR